MGLKNKIDQLKVLKIDIDLVYLWVDGNDPIWKEKKNSFTGMEPKGADTDCEGRYASFDELKFSLRSAELYAPWIRRIFIVTDRQVPEWLDTSNPRVRIVDHTEILPAECLPTFNSVVIEHALHKIPHLGEHFLYANDDMLFNRPMAPSDFFTEEGLPIIRMNRKPFRRLSLWVEKHILGRKISTYNLTILNSAMLVKQKYGKFIGSKIHHNITAYRKSDYAHACEVFGKEIAATMGNRLRSETDIQRNLYSYVALAERRGKLKYVTGKSSFHLQIYKRYHYERLMRTNPQLFCVNDSEWASEEDRQVAGEFLARRFPLKSSFEK